MFTSASHAIYRIVILPYESAHKLSLFGPGGWVTDAEGNRVEL